MADHRPASEDSVIDANDELEVAATDRGLFFRGTSLAVERDAGVLQNAAVSERSVWQRYLHDVSNGRARTSHPPDVCMAGRVDGLLGECSGMTPEDGPQQRHLPRLHCVCVVG